MQSVCEPSKELCLLSKTSHKGCFFLPRNVDRSEIIVENGGKSILILTLYPVLDKFFALVCINFLSPDPLLATLGMLNNSFRLGKDGVSFVD